MSKIETAVKAAVKANWADFANDIKDPAKQKRYAAALTDFTTLTAEAALSPARAAELAPEIALARSTMASLAAVGAQKANRAAKKTRDDIMGVLLKAMTVAIVGI